MKKEIMKEHIKMTLGPMLLLMALVTFLSKYSFPMALLGVIAAVSMPVVWRFQLKGALYGAGSILVAFATIYALHEPPYVVFWIFVWCLTLVAALIVMALCSQEYHTDQLVHQQEYQQKLDSLQKEHQSKHHLLSLEKEEVSRRASSLEETLRKKEEHLASLKQLVIAAKEEADKYFMQCEHLNQEVLTLHRQLGFMEELSLRHATLETSHKTLLNELNTLRVNSYQYELLAFSKKIEQVAEAPLEQEDVLQQLEQLERERAMVKKSYEMHLRDYQAIVDKLQTLCTLDELAYYTHRELSFEESYKDLKALFQEKGKTLQELRVEIFKTEGAMLQLKKTLKSPIDETSPGSYLMVADQECLRLEEENSILLELISHALPLLEKRVERSSKESLESHSHHE